MSLDLLVKNKKFSNTHYVYYNIILCFQTLNSLYKSFVYLKPYSCRKMQKKTVREGQLVQIAPHPSCAPEPHLDLKHFTKWLIDYTRYPIEKYVGWATLSSNFIFNISGVIPLLEKPFFVFEIFAAKSIV